MIKKRFILSPLLINLSLSIAPIAAECETDKPLPVENSTRSIEVDVKGSYLFWNAREDQLGFAIEGVSFLASESLQKGVLKTNQGGWHSGVRVEAGITDTKNVWELGVTWTHFKSHSTNTAQSTMPMLTATTIILLIPGPPFATASSAVSTWNMTFNTYSLDLSLDCSNHPNVAFKPHLGVLGAVIDQTQAITYTNIDASGDNVGMTRSSDFWGVGPSAGFALSWNFYKPLFLVGDISFAVPFGQIKAQSAENMPPDIAASYVRLKSTWNRGRPMTAALLGLEWQQSIQNKATILVNASYEFQYFWQLWHSASNGVDALLSGDGRWGDLSLHGLTLTAGISF